MNPSIIDYYIINCAIPSIITFEHCYQIDFGKPAWDLHTVCIYIYTIGSRYKNQVS